MIRQSVIIAFIGRGQRNNMISGLSYVKSYDEACGSAQPPETPLSLSVLRQRHTPQRIHLLGTRSSSWNALIDDIPLDDPTMAFRDELRQEADAATLDDAAPGVDDAHLRRLGTMLAAHWRCAVEITAVAQRNVTEANVESILRLMIGLCERVAPDERLILDTTHGPRPLSQMALSAIQVVEGLTPGLFARTEISYGDLVYGGRVSTADGTPANRSYSVNLTAIRGWVEVAHAAAVFERSMNPMLLAEYLRRDGFADLADSLEQLGRVIATNAFEQLPGVIRQLRHAVQACACTRQEYGDLLRRHLGRLILRLDQPTPAATLRCLAEQRAACGEYAQAILALYASLVDLACPHEVEYESMKQQLKRLRDLLTPREQQQFDALEYARNAVAHGLRRVSATAPLPDAIAAYHDGHAFITSIDWTSVAARLHVAHSAPQPPHPRQAHMQRLLNELKPGDIRIGRVSSLHHFGAFIDLGGADGLAHRSELAWHRITHPGDVLVQGQDVRVQVLKINPARQRISLSLKQLLPDPREQLLNELRPGDIRTGRVSSLAAFGAIIDLDGIDGLAPTAELAWHRVTHPGDVLVQGQEVRAKVLQVDPARTRIILSLKQLLPDPRERLLHALKPGTTRTGRVTELCPFGAFIDLGGIEGLVHRSELARHDVKHPDEVLVQGQDVHVKVLRIDLANKRVTLSLKQLLPDPWETVGQRYAIGQLVSRPVVNVALFGAFVQIEDAVEGLIHVSELDGAAPQQGETVTVRIISLDTQRQRMGLSLRHAQEPRVDDATGAVPQG